MHYELLKKATDDNRRFCISPKNWKNIEFVWRFLQPGLSIWSHLLYVPKIKLLKTKKKIDTN